MNTNLLILYSYMNFKLLFCNILKVRKKKLENLSFVLLLLSEFKIYILTEIK